MRTYAAGAAERTEAVTGNDSLPDEEVEDLARDLEELAGGPNGPGGHYIVGALGTLAASYSSRRRMGPVFDIARIIGHLTRSRVAAAGAQLARSAADKGHSA